MSFYFAVHMTDEAAEKHTRRTHGIPENVGLGWKPYNYLLTRDSLSVGACYTEHEFERLLSAHHMNPPKWSTASEGVRFSSLESADLGGASQRETRASAPDGRNRHPLNLTCAQQHGARR